MKHLEQNDQNLLAEVRSVAERMSVLEGLTGRRSWPDEGMARIVLESFEPGARVSDVARRHGLTLQHLSSWRGLAQAGKLVLPEVPDAEPGFAVLQIEDDDPVAAPRGWIEIEAVGVALRLPQDTPAVRIAEIAVALGKAQHPRP
ncbi:MAG: transposase [Pseudomonadota bacterium]